MQRRSRSDKTTNPPPSRHGRRTPNEPADRVTLYGRHAVLAALANPARTPLRLVVAEPNDAPLAAAAAARGLRPETADALTLQRLAGSDAVHQGIVLVARPLPPADLAEIAAAGRRVVVLDQVEDPRNVGAILRSAAAFGPAALVIQTRHAPPLGGVCAKAASGALDWVPIAQEVNLARALRFLQDGGYWIAGLDGRAERSLQAFRPAAKQALVLGAEGKGIRPLVREHCDTLLRIHLQPPVESLNVAVTAGIALCHLATTPPS